MARQRAAADATGTDSKSAKAKPSARAPGHATGSRTRDRETTALGEYRSKRDASKTPEPMGRRRQANTRQDGLGSFVIQEHHARAMHWDFRLEHDGVLVSWALPKGVPLDPGQNHLAVHTEDHPLEYGSFAGTIPAGEYGAGTVTIWDFGSYELEKWTEDEVKVVLHGHTVEGRYVLFATHDKSWMIHRMDPAPTGTEPLADHVRPMLALAGTLPESDEGWGYEFKWDGVRAAVRVDGGRVRVVSRNDKDLTSTFPELRSIGEQLGARPALLDGEIVAFDDEGRPSFSKLQRRLHVESSREVARRASETPAVYLAFDLLHLDGHSLLARTYDERRAALESLGLAGSAVAVPEAFVDASGADVLRAAKDGGLEGVVAKRRDSPYRPGQRSGEWLKVKNFRTQEVIIGGWTEGAGNREGSLGALLLGVPAAGGLNYVGKVGTGFGDEERRTLLRSLQPIERATSPFVNEERRAERTRVHYVSPKLVGEVRYGEWTSDGRLRHPSWRGLRPDKSASEVEREQ